MRQGCPASGIWPRGTCLVHTRRFFGLGEGGPSSYLGTPLGQFGRCQSRLPCCTRQRTSSPNLKYRFNSDVRNRLREQRRLSILSCNPGPRRGREGAIEEHTAWKWHVIALQEAIEYLQRECLTKSPFNSTTPGMGNIKS